MQIQVQQKPTFLVSQRVEGDWLFETDNCAMVEECSWMIN